VENGDHGSAGEGDSREPGMNAPGESDGPIVPRKRANKGARAPAESVEGRGPTKGNASQEAAHRTRGRKSALNGLARVREVARQDRRARFTALLHHVNVDLLRASYNALKRDAAPGVDGVTWKEYGEGLEERLVDLHDRVHKGSYRAQPSRRVYIPKADGRERPLGIAALEDKIVQHAVVRVLNQIYEEDFLGFSYGFRPGRGQHDALDALAVGLSRRVKWVLDADIQGFFDTIDHGWLMKMIEHRVADRRVIRLIRKWLKVGTLEDGKRTPGTVGTPQGAVISPLLANIYLHYVLDVWIQQWRKRQARGGVVVVRYADDFVVGLESRQDATALMEALKRRMEKFGLKLHPGKTRLIEFGRFADRNRKDRGQGKPETFDFLGLTHYWGKTKEGKPTLKRRSSRKRLTAKMREIRDHLKRHRHDPIRVTGAWLRAVVQGYFNYHAVPHNLGRLWRFWKAIARAWHRTLCRRSQTGHVPWARMKRLARTWLPQARILHPYPTVRFYARYPR
jgi:RNA-directed DNA polymerase